MLKKRVVASLIVKDGIVVQSIKYKKYLPIGRPDIALEYLNSWGIDEVIMVDISASKQKRIPDYEMIKEATKKCYVPLTIGGGITEISHIKKLMQCGADKIALNQTAIYKPELINKSAKIFGSQCIVVSIDGIWTENGYRVYDYVEAKPLTLTPKELALRVQDLGAGEILINSVDHDGTYNGFNMDLINEVCEIAIVPVIGFGGARNSDDFVEVFKNTKVSAASAGNLFHFTEHSVNMTKANIKKEIDIRLETYASYAKNNFDENFRLKKKMDKELEDLLYIKIEKEII